jgi:hypothetical protein
MSKRGTQMKSASLTKMLLMIAALLVVLFFFSNVIKREGMVTPKPTMSGNPMAGLLASMRK